jgi:hypothetical protein
VLPPHAPERRVSHQFSLAQSNAFRIAIDMVVALLGSESKISRTEISRVALRMANQGDFSAAVIAKMTLAELDERERRTG